MGASPKIIFQEPPQIFSLPQYFKPHPGTEGGDGPKEGTDRKRGRRCKNNLFPSGRTPRSIRSDARDRITVRCITH
jgi:hypothetical protein